MSSTSTISLPDRIKAKNTFDRVVCWRSDDTREILDIEATRSSDAVFMATHSPVAMRRQERHDRDASTTYNEDDFLNDFLDPNEGFRFIPVLGKTGVGKSHLVRWLDIQIRGREDDTQREVLLVEKAGSNLRTVLERILNMDTASGEAFDPYRERLEKAAEDIAEGELKERILVELRFAVQNYESMRLGGKFNNGERGVKGYVSELLPKLLKSPYFEEDWLVEGGVIDRTYKRSFKNTNQHDRPAFDRDSLPLEKSQAEVQKHAPNAGNAYRKLDRDNLQEAAVEVLNECLGIAVGRLLHFKGDDLLQLMINIRREFGRQDVELVLLIEDIAAVQGLDRQLLASLEPRDEELGVLRTAMGCTDGYFDSNIPETTKARADFLLDLNVKNRGQVDLATFTARYLNAIRVGRDQLASALNGGADVPHACEACPFSSTCHEAFGSRNGTPGEDAMGLYPFTEAALETLYEGISDQAFNPRQLITNVLRSVLVNHTSDLKNGDFPPSEIRETYRFQQSLSVDVITEQNWRKEDSEHADQRILLADTWSRMDNGEDLSPVVFEAFGIDVDPSSLPDSADPDTPTTGGNTDDDAPGAGDSAAESEDAGRGTVANDDQREDEEQPDAENQSAEEGATADNRGEQLTQKERELREHEEALNKWAQGVEQGGKMPQSLVERLRGIVHEAVVHRIDWDAEGLSESFFARQSMTAFCKTSIDFTGGNTDQDVRSKNRRVQLELPMVNQAAVDIRIALEGLLRAQHHDGWAFENGRKYLIQVATCLEVWAGHVVDQLRRPCRDKPCWNPAPAAAELLAVRARLAGVDMGPDAPLRDRVNALFQSYSPPAEYRGDAWTKVATELHTAQDDLIAILEAHVWLRKGTGARTKVYDVEQFASVLDSLDEHDALQAPFYAESKDELREQYRPLWSARGIVKRYLSRAVSEETETLTSWMKKVNDAFDSDTSLNKQVNQVSNAVYAARDTAERTLFSSRDLDTYNDRAENAQSEEAQDAVDFVRKFLKTAENASALGSMITGLGRDPHHLRKQVEDYIMSAKSLFQSIQDGLQSDIATRERGGLDLQRTLADIENDLDALHDELTTLRDLNTSST